jgi:hypothetical protein
VGAAACRSTVQLSGLPGKSIFASHILVSNYRAKLETKLSRSLKTYCSNGKPGFQPIPGEGKAMMKAMRL